MVKGCERFPYIVKQWEREWRESQDGSLLPKPGDYQAMNTAEKAGAGPATSWPPSPYPRAAREGWGGGGIFEVKYIKSRFCQVSKYA